MFNVTIYHFLLILGHIMKWVQSSIVRVVRCIIHRHWHHCYCHYHKWEVSVLDSSPSLPTKQSSSNSIPSCNLYLSTSSENRWRLHACGGGGDSGGIWWLHSRQIEIVTHWKQLSGNATRRQLQRFFKEQFKQGRSHQTIERICEARDTTPALGLLTGDNIRERSR